MRSIVLPGQLLLWLLLLLAPLVRAQSVLTQDSSGAWVPLAENNDISGRVLSRTDRIYRLYNDSDATLSNPSFSEIEQPAVFDIQFTTSAGAIPVGEYREFRVRFEPQQEMNRQVIIAIEFSAPAETFYFGLHAVATGEPNMSIYGWGEYPNGSSTPIADANGSTFYYGVTDFGTVNIASGGTRTYNFKIINSGNLPLTIHSISNPSSDFTVQGISPTPSAPLVVPAQSSSDFFTILFHPQTEGNKSAEISFNTDNEPDPTYSIYVKGVASNSLADIDVVYLTDGTPSFGLYDGMSFSTVADIGGTTQKQFRIRNLGSQTLVVSSATANGTTVLPGASITANGQVDFNIPVTSNVVQQVNYTVHIYSNDPDAESDFLFTMAVNFIDPNAPPDVDVRGAPLGGTISSVSAIYIIQNGADAAAAVKANGTKYGSRNTFGDVRVVNDSETHTFWVRNLSAQNLEIGSYSLSGAAAGEYIVANFPANTTLEPYQIKYFTIKFDPDLAGSREAEFSFATNSPGKETFNFTLVGPAVDNPIQDLVVDRYDASDNNPLPIANGTVIQRAALEINDAPTPEQTLRLRNVYSTAIPLELTGPITSDRPEITFQYLYGSTQPASYPYEIVAAFFFKPLITLAPGTPDPLVATISIPTNDPDTPVFTYTLEARVYDATQYPRLTRIETETTSFQGPDRLRVRFFGYGDPRVTYRMSFSHDLDTWSIYNQPGMLYVNSPNSKGTLSEQKFAELIVDKAVWPKLFSRIGPLNP
ncbi:choice-of-anchor D domain-containing protein [Haloferula sargassicola]|uniref:HYDIN/VesB/CFA65-like Ig-like domain-containing protein n=1 Tax=Haloferula sargassicola TaxID=490096 RepID=A0ABP9UKS0_9BACT